MGPFNSHCAAFLDSLLFLHTLYGPFCRLGPFSVRAPRPGSPSSELISPGLYITLVYARPVVCTHRSGLTRKATISCWVSEGNTETGSPGLACSSAAAAGSTGTLSELRSCRACRTCEIGRHKNTPGHKSFRYRLTTRLTVRTGTHDAGLCHTGEKLRD